MSAAFFTNLHFSSTIKCSCMMTNCSSCWYNALVSTSFSICAGRKAGWAVDPYSLLPTLCDSNILEHINLLNLMFLMLVYSYQHAMQLLYALWGYSFSSCYIYIFHDLSHRNAWINQNHHHHSFIPIGTVHRYSSINNKTRKPGNTKELLNFKKSSFHPIPSTWGLLGLHPPNKAPSPPNWNMKHYKSVEFCQFLERQAPHTNANPPRKNTKPPY